MKQDQEADQPVPAMAHPLSPRRERAQSPTMQAQSPPSSPHDPIFQSLQAESSVSEGKKKLGKGKSKKPGFFSCGAPKVDRAVVESARRPTTPPRGQKRSKTPPRRSGGLCSAPVVITEDEESDGVSQQPEPELEPEKQLELVPIGGSVYEQASFAIAVRLGEPPCSPSLLSTSDMVGAAW